MRQSSGQCPSLELDLVPLKTSVHWGLTVGEYQGWGWVGEDCGVGRSQREEWGFTGRSES